MTTSRSEAAAPPTREDVATVMRRLRDLGFRVEVSFGRCRTIGLARRSVKGHTHRSRSGFFDGLVYGFFSGDAGCRRTENTHSDIAAAWRDGKALGEELRGRWLPAELSIEGTEKGVVRGS